jgi:hypothetical protein
MDAIRRWRRRWWWQYGIPVRRAVCAGLLRLVRGLGGEDTEVAQLEEELRLARTRRDGYKEALIAIHKVVSDKPFYSWQRTLQEVRSLKARVSEWEEV